jgi:glycerol-3-phosphate acyltransferase PlsY
MNYFWAFLIGYFLGSIPTAFLLVKKSNKIDITESGSGNVGAMNSYRVSGSKILALIILCIDYLKGFLAVFIAISLIESSFEIASIVILSAVVGHCYSIWIKFRGGRGLATAAGATTLYSPLSLGIWVFFWIIGYLFKKNIHFSNISASVLLAILSFTSSDILIKYCLIETTEGLKFSIFSALVLLIILLKHTSIILDYLKFYKKGVHEK